ncbi:MAG: InlB B-repeat-containing protein, partial [Paludibacteraceae bacterium]
MKNIFSRFLILFAVTFVSLFAATQSAWGEDVAMSSAVSAEVTTDYQPRDIQRASSTSVFYIVSGKCNETLTAGMSQSNYQILKCEGGATSAITGNEIVSSSNSATSSFFYNSTSVAEADLLNTGNYVTSSGNNVTMQGLKVSSNATVTLTLNKTISKVVIVGRCGRTSSASLTIKNGENILETIATSAQDMFVKTYENASGFTNISMTSASKEYYVFVYLWETSSSSSYTVTYDANGGTCSTTSDTYSGTPLTLPTATQDGYTFKGWYDAATDGNRIGGAGDTYTPTANITLYAQWAPVSSTTFIVTFDYNDEGATASTSESCYEGSTVTLPTPTRTGYTFKGWYDAAIGGNLLAEATATEYTPTADITLYAQWEVIAEPTCITDVYYNTVPTGKTQSTRFTFSSTPSGDNSLANTMTIDGVNYTCASRSSSTSSTFSFTIPDGKEATLYMCVCGGGNSRVMQAVCGKDTLSVEISNTKNSDDSYKTFKLSNLTAGTWTVTCIEKLGTTDAKSWYLAMLGLQECKSSACETPNISAQPVGGTYCAGDVITLSIEASVSDAGTLSYQWQKDGADISGATAETYTPTEAGTYACVVTNTLADHTPASVTSNEAVITINPAPAITTQPASVSVTVNNPATLTVVATDATAYQWYTCDNSNGDNPSAISGETNNTLTVTPDALGTIYYKVIVTGTCGTATSDVVSITATDGPCFSMAITATSGSISGQTQLTSSHASITGGTVLYDREAKESMEFSSDGIKFNSNSDYLKVTLSEGVVLAQGTQIKVTYTIISDNRGIKILQSDKETEVCSFSKVKGTYTETFTITSSMSENVFYITRVDGTAYLKIIELSNCGIECLETKPTLTADKDALCGTENVVFTAKNFTEGATLALYKEGDDAPLQTVNTTTETSVTFAAVSVSATANYYVVANKTCDVSSDLVPISILPATQITTQPTGATIWLSGKTTLTVEATG